MGDKWQEGVYNEEKLIETLHLLPWNSNALLNSKENTSDQFSLQRIPSDTCIANASSSAQINYNQPSIINKSDNEPSDNSDHVKGIKERHISIDSARDSGIGENSNFTDIDTSKFDEETDSKNIDTNELSETDGNCASTSTTESLLQSSNTNEADMRGFWQPKQKRSITERLPQKSFYLIHPSRYIFPGAELYIDPDEKINYFDSMSSDSSDSDSETETENIDSSF